MIDLGDSIAPRRAEFGPIACIEAAPERGGRLHLIRCGARYLHDHVAGAGRFRRCLGEAFGAWIVMALCLWRIPLAASIGGIEARAENRVITLWRWFARIGLSPTGTER